MKLRTKLFLLFSLLSLVLVSLATAITYWLASSALVSELEGLSDRAADRSKAYVALRGAEAARTVTALSREPSLRGTLALIASGAEEPQSPQVVGLAEKSAAGTDFDVFEILDGEGIVLSSAHWKASYGKPHRDAVSVARMPGGSPAAVVIDVRGRRRVSLVSAVPVTIGGSRFFVLGGYYMDSQPLRELEDLLDVSVTLVPLTAARGAPGAADETDSARAPATPAAGAAEAAGEGASISSATHVVREVYLPHCGDSPAAKLVIGVSRQRLDRLADSLRRAFVLAAASALAISWVVAFVLARGITRPLERLTAGARVVASGDLTAVVAGEGPDELGQLVRSFNKMVADLGESRTRIARMERIAAWREVARRIAHEIKNALSPIQLSIENVQRSHAKGSHDFDRVLSTATATVRDEVQGLRRMVDEFSQFARMPAPTLARHDVRRVAERVVNLHEGSRPGVAVTLSVPAGPVEAMIDADQLSRALGNVVANAIEACRDGGRVSVELSQIAAGAGAAWVRIAVRDTGLGIAPELLENIFEPYYTTKEHGTGLGLSIVMKIVTDHGGTVEVESRQDEGSTFTILVPAERDPRRLSGGAALVCQRFNGGEIDR